MGSISSSTGLISGIDYNSLINQLLSLEARPKLLAQRRVAGLQTDQAAFLDLNSKLNALKSAAAAFRTGNTFGASTVGSGFGCGLGNGFGASTLGGSGFTSSTFAGGVAALRGAKVADRICAGVEDLPPSRMPGSRNSKPACSRMDAARHDARARWCESTSSRTNGETRACMGLLWYRQVLPLRIRPVLLPRERWQSSPLEQFIGGTVHWRLLVRRLMLGAGAKPAGTYRPQGQNPAKAM